jgi:alkylhydroperoxidase family enzyme
VPVEVTNAIRDDTPVPDSKLEALRQFTTRLVEDRGWVNETEVLTFIEAGYTRANVLDVIVGVGLKTLSNYINHIAGTELDASFAGRAWQAPA